MAWKERVDRGLRSARPPSERRGAIRSANKAHLLMQSDVTNPDQYAGYAKLTPAIIGPAYSAARKLRAGAAPTQTVLVEGR